MVSVRNLHKDSIRIFTRGNFFQYLLLDRLKNKNIIKPAIAGVSLVRVIIKRDPMHTCSAPDQANGIPGILIQNIYLRTVRNI